jgi:hypothetical protein
VAPTFEMINDTSESRAALLYPLFRGPSALVDPINEAIRDPVLAERASFLGMHGSEPDRDDNDEELPVWRMRTECTVGVADERLVSVWCSVGMSKSSAQALSRRRGRLRRGAGRPRILLERNVCAADRQQLLVQVP